MNPIHFPEQTVVFAKDQPEYLPLPALCIDDDEGTVISCWKLSWWERVKLLFSGKLWLLQLTFNQGLQPLLPSIEKPFQKVELSAFKIPERSPQDWN